MPKRGPKPKKPDVSNWTRENVAWLAGLFEGEGCIFVYDYKRDKEPRFALYINMTDEDVLVRAKEVAGIGTLTGPRVERDGTKPIWRWAVHFNPHVVALCFAMYPFFGSRMKAKIAAVLEKWRDIGRERGAQEELPIAA